MTVPVVNGCDVPLDCERLRITATVMCGVISP
jgi:hypothetical protein